LKPAPTSVKNIAVSSPDRRPGRHKRRRGHSFLGADAPSYPEVGARCALPRRKTPATTQVVIAGSFRWISLRQVLEPVVSGLSSSSTRTGCFSTFSNMALLK